MPTQNAVIIHSRTNHRQINNRMGVTYKKKKKKLLKYIPIKSTKPLPLSTYFFVFFFNRRTSFDVEKKLIVKIEFAITKSLVKLFTISLYWSLCIASVSKNEHCLTLTREESNDIFYHLYTIRWWQYDVTDNDVDINLICNTVLSSK